MDGDKRQRIPLAKDGWNLEPFFAGSEEMRADFQKIPRKLFLWREQEDTWSSLSALISAIRRLQHFEVGKF